MYLKLVDPALRGDIQPSAGANRSIGHRRHNPVLRRKGGQQPESLHLHPGPEQRGSS
jgi:hypothetical protein